MIRPFSVFCKLNQIKFSDRQWFECESGVGRLYSGECPSCGSRECLSHLGQYKRYLVTVQGGGPESHEIFVTRECCSSCRHTHALLPSCLVPYTSYSLRFILHVLRLYFLRLKTVEWICQTFCIAVSTLYRWKQLFLTHKALWFGILEDLRRESATFLEGITGRFLFLFMETYRVSFLEKTPGRYRELPFCLEDRGAGIT